VSGESGRVRGVLENLEEQLRGGQVPSLPGWLVPLPYAAPRVAGYRHPIVHLLEVVDELPPELALVRLARHYQAVGDVRMDEVLARSLAEAPSAAGLAMSAQLQGGRGDRAGMVATVERLRTLLGGAPPIALEDRLEAAIALGLTGDGAGLSQQLGAVLAQADEAQLRRLRTERLSLLVDLSVQFGLDRTYPATVATARMLLASAR
jgi:hypothetical protein